ncbi:MAG TPA: rhomboid family intramembrane serine protease [Longimicrobiales bacterium]|nr:rhomboid family intramembrane serine protease [Longimicrobiales bacterium]
MAYRGNISFGFGLTPWVKNLIIANAAVFLVDYMMGGVLRSYMAFVPARVLVEPWTLITYMFSHGNFWHLFWNMLGLFFFGPPLEARWGSREFLKFYLIAGLGGAALSFLLAFSSPIIGASGAVYGIMLAFAMNWPDSPIYIWGILPVPAKYLVGFLAVFSLLSMWGGNGGNIAHAAHLGGFAAGFIYLKFAGPGGGAAGFRKMMNKRKLKVVSVEEQPRPRTVPGSAGPTVRRRGGTEEEEKLLDELDRVLEKISTQGMSSLTAQERKLLDEVSRRYRTD